MGEELNHSDRREKVWPSINYQYSLATSKTWCAQEGYSFIRPIRAEVEEMNGGGRGKSKKKLKKFTII